MALCTLTLGLQRVHIRNQPMKLQEPKGQSHKFRVELRVKSHTHANTTQHNARTHTEWSLPGHTDVPTPTESQHRLQKAD